MGCLPPINWCRILLGHNPSMVCMVKINTVLYSFNITCNKYHFALRQNIWHNDGFSVHELGWSSSPSMDSTLFIDRAPPALLVLRPISGEVKTGIPSRSSQKKTTKKYLRKTVFSGTSMEHLWNIYTLRIILKWGSPVDHRGAPCWNEAYWQLAVDKIKKKNVKGFLFLMVSKTV